LQTDKPLEGKAHNLPGWLRLLAILAGGLSGFGGFLVFGIVFCFVPVVLILGAIIQPYVPRLGRWVFSVGAMLVTVYVVLFLVPQAFGAITMLRHYHEPHDLAVLSLFVLSTALVIWLDAALVRNEKVKKTS
jgi:glucan phosphoethanolaminetransferase (alkaline phosphatase superfamily)